MRVAVSLLPKSAPWPHWLPWQACPRKGKVSRSGLGWARGERPAPSRRETGLATVGLPFACHFFALISLFLTEILNMSFASHYQMKEQPTPRPFHLLFSHWTTTNGTKLKARGQSVEDRHPLFGCRVFRVGCRIQTALLACCFTRLSADSQLCTQLTRPILKHIYQPSYSRGHAHASVRQHVKSCQPSARGPGCRGEGRRHACFLATNSWSVYRGDWLTAANRAQAYRTDRGDPTCPRRMQ